MARNAFYTQCTLRRPTDDPCVFAVTVSWIPSDCAQRGRTVRLKRWPSDEAWSEGWVVMHVGHKMAGDKVEANELDYKKQREASDV